MPTHQDYPWERDARKWEERRGGGAARRTRLLERPAVVWGVLAVAGLVVVLQLPARTDQADPGASFAPVVPTAPGRTVPPSSSSPYPAAPRPTPRSAGSVTDLRTRYVGTANLEIWGTTNAADGASVEIRVTTARGGHEHVTAAPSAGGHFYASARIPRAMRGRQVSVEARVAR